ncbi:hypothetical protein ACFVGY_30520 [Streptomyces sp. NPDC127106]|uniref:hypothetical protein n=1 Tax=Streptomyces sp. NPDC127106 TaxID=3345360 RepID=UPI0036383C04
MGIDTEQVPLSPVFTITLTSSGVATLDGEEVSAPGLTPEQARLAALAEVRIKAAFHGRPVRVVAKEATGVWPLIVDVDGSVTTLDQPHPTAAPTPAPAPHAPARAVPMPRLDTPPLATETQQPSHGIGGDDWTGPLPATYRVRMEGLRAQDEAGALADAIVTAYRIETDLAQEYGPKHPHTLNMMTLRAGLTVRSTATDGHWADTAELLIETAERRRDAGAPPAETIRVIANAHAVWRKLREQDPETARELASRLLDIIDALALLGSEDNGEARARDVVRWMQTPAARPAAG